MDRINGQGWEEWARALFEFEFCPDCGGDWDEHDPAVVLGNWFARCRQDPDMFDDPEDPFLDDKIDRLKEARREGH